MGSWSSSLNIESLSKKLLSCLKHIETEECSQCNCKCDVNTSQTQTMSHRGTEEAKALGMGLETVVRNRCAGELTVVL